MATQEQASDTYVTDLIEILAPHVNGLSRRLVLTSLRRSRERKGLPIPDTFEETVQSVFNQHCIQSEVFRNRSADDNGFFCSVHDGNTAVWVVDTRRADAWWRTRSPLYDLAQAIGRIKRVPTEQALAKVEEADEATRKKWRNNVQVKAVMAQIRAEKAMEALEREEVNLDIGLSFAKPSNENDDT